MASQFQRGGCGFSKSADCMWKVWIHAGCTSGISLALNKDTWVEYAEWVQYGAGRKVFMLLLNGFLCSCIFTRFRWLLRACSTAVFYLDHVLLLSCLVL